MDDKEAERWVDAAMKTICMDMLLKILAEESKQQVVTDPIVKTLKMHMERKGYE